MKSVVFVLAIIGVSAKADINLTPGSSATVAGQQITCGSGNTAPALLNYNCLCHNSGRTDNPPPHWIQFQVQDQNDAIAEGQRQCSQLNYGRPDFGFSPVDNCHQD